MNPDAPMCPNCARLRHDLVNARSAAMMLEDLVKMLKEELDQKTNTLNELEEYRTIVTGLHDSTDWTPKEV